MDDLKKITMVLSIKELKRAADIDALRSGERPNKSRFMRKLIRKYIKDNDFEKPENTEDISYDN